jgi:hypothetical protein
MATGPFDVRKGANMEDLLQKLKLSDVEKDGVFLAKEDRGNLPKVKWMTVGKLLTRKSFSEESLRWTMLAAWNAGRVVTFRATERNLFTIQAHCLGDWKRIMEEEPWLFRDYVLMVEKFDGATTTPSVILKKVQTWIQIHNPPSLPNRSNSQATGVKGGGCGEGGEAGGIFWEWRVP